MGMISVTELRVGNWVYNDNIPIRIGREYMSYLCDYPTSNTAKPIPLTPDVLIAAKFHKDNYGLFEKVKDDKPYISGCEIELWVKQCEVNGEKVWDVCIGEGIDSITHLSYKKYLHQLQNLYFSLTETELEINL